MDNQTKYVLTVDAQGTVVQVQKLGEDGSLSDVPVANFFWKLTLPSFSTSEALSIQTVTPLSPNPPKIHQAPPPSPSAPSTPKKPPKKKTPNPASTPKKPRRPRH